MRQILGVDIGQASDYTALVVLEHHDAPEALNVIHLERMRHIPYPQIVKRILDVHGALQKRGTVDLVCDSTGVGKAVVDLLSSANPVRVSIHGGVQVTGERRVFGVPKKDLAASVITAFETGVLKIAADLELGPVLAQEAMRFEARIKPNGGSELAADWREKDHDDLLLALCVAAWWTKRPRGNLPRQPSRVWA